MNQKHKLIKISSIIFGTLLIIGLCIILLISPITRHLIEKYDEQLTGRKITVGWVYVNPFTGYFHCSNLKVFEYRSDSLFITAKSLNVDISLRKLLTKTIEISAVTMVQPTIVVDNNNKKFNFNDIILKFTPKKSKHKPSGIHVNILGIKIINGIIHYREPLVPVNYFIKNLCIESPGKRWNSDSIDVKYSFQSGTRKGDMKGDFSMNVKKLNYRLVIMIHTFDLKVLEPYIKDMKNYGTFSADLEANLIAKGNFKNAADVTFTGMVAINKFHFGKNPKEDYGSFDKLQLSILQLSPRDNKYLFDTVSLTHPYAKFERYDASDNIQKMFVKKGSKHSGSNPTSFNLLTTIGNYIAKLSVNFFHSNYKINRLALNNGYFIFNDYSLSEKFSVEMTPVTIISDSIDKNRNRAFVAFKSNIKPYGNININLSIHPKDSSNFDLNYHFKRLPATLFNPYLISLTSYPLNRGIIELNGAWHVRKSKIKSINHLEIIDPRIAGRVHNKDTKWLPMWLVMAIVRDRGNVIDYQVPVTGNLKNPKLHLNDVIFNALENIIVKPATTPYRIMLKNVETEIEKSLTLKWEMHKTDLDKTQERFIKKMVAFLKKNPDAIILVHPQLFIRKEKEYILLFEAKKNYYLVLHHKNSNSFNSDDSTLVENMSIKDTHFVHFLNYRIKDPLIYTVQEKSSILLGSRKVDKKIVLLNKEREKVFLDIFREKGVEKQVKFTSIHHVIPFNGYSYYKITYKGEFPESLLKAHRKMNELNNKEPRKEYKKDRKSTDKTN